VGAAAEFSWWVNGAEFTLKGTGGARTVCAEAFAAPGTAGEVHVEVTHGGGCAIAQARLEVVAPAEEEEGTALGIPEPVLVNDPAGLWRSRMARDTWEINEAHEDYVRLRAESKARMRYLLSLLAKELVQRSFAQPGSEQLLERMVEILAHAERNLRGA
jgi:hypothetical protein